MTLGGKLWVQDLDREGPRELAGTEGARGPFWSPDSRFIGFQSDSALKKIPARGGPAVVLCQLNPIGFAGGAWSPDGNAVIFASGVPSGVYAAPGYGGSPDAIFEAGPIAHRNPLILRKTQGLQRIVVQLGAAPFVNLVLVNVQTGAERVIARGAFPAYSPSGHIVYQTAELTPGLWALPFSVEKLEPTGEAFLITADGAIPSVAADGTLAYTKFIAGGPEQLVWRDRTGVRLGTIGSPQERIGHPVLSPDGRRVAVEGVEDGNKDIWVHEIDRGVKRRLTFHPADEWRPTWSPTGNEITFSLPLEGSDDILSVSADGGGDPVLLVATAKREIAPHWSPDGEYLAYHTDDSDNPENARDLWYSKRKPDGSGFESVPFRKRAPREQAAKFSPDGRFIAYCSDEAGLTTSSLSRFQKVMVDGRCRRTAARSPVGAAMGRNSTMWKATPSWRCRSPPIQTSRSAPRNVCFGMRASG